MGADMYVAVVAIEANATPDYDAGRAFIEKLDLTEDVIQQLRDFGGLDVCEEEFFDDDDNPKVDEIRAWLVNSVGEFDDVVNSRRAATIQVRDLWVTIVGGLSWGDIPDGAEMIGRMEAVPGLLGVMGYCTDWHQPAQPEVTPEAEAAAIQSIQAVNRV